MPISASELIKDVAGLVSLPDVFFRINRLIEDPHSTTADIARAVSKDPAFTLRLLAVANSSLFRFPASVTSVSKAVSIIGTAQVRSLVLAMSVAKSFAGLPNELVSMGNFWRHSLFCALIARRLAKEMGRCDPDGLFTAGLLHDIGELILFNRLPQQAKDALLLVLDSQDEIQVHQAERQIIGVDHAAVGGELARHWNLPALLQECIAFHHSVGDAKQFPREVALIHLANVFALMAELDSIAPSDVSPADPLAWELTGLAADCAETVVREAQSDVAEVEQLFT